MTHKGISIIVAMTPDRVIGDAGGMPWSIPEDLQYFQKMTLGKSVIMGRKTFESIGKPLPRRQNIVLTRDPTWESPGVTVANCLAQALLAAHYDQETMIIGGGVLYRATLPLATRLYLTEVHGHYSGDTYFPEFAYDDWSESSRISSPTHDYVILDRRVP